MAAQQEDPPSPGENTRRCHEGPSSLDSTRRDPETQPESTSPSSGDAVTGRGSNPAVTEGAIACNVAVLLISSGVHPLRRGSSRQYAWMQIHMGRERVAQPHPYSLLAGVAGAPAESGRAAASAMFPGFRRIRMTRSIDGFVAPRSACIVGPGCHGLLWATSLPGGADRRGACSAYRAVAGRDARARPVDGGAASRDVGSRSRERGRPRPSWSRRPGRSPPPQQIPQAAWSDGSLTTPERAAFHRRAATLRELALGIARDAEHMRLEQQVQAAWDLRDACDGCHSEFRGPRKLEP